MQRLRSGRMLALLATLLVIVGSARAAAPPALALSAAQAQQALEVLDNPQQRAQVETTLRAIIAAGTLNAPPAAASAGAAAATAASSAVPAPSALQSNGLASQLVRQGARWIGELGLAVRDSLRSLLDIESVGAWWKTHLSRADTRAALIGFIQVLAAALLPALLFEGLVRRLLRRPLATLAAQDRQTAERSAARHRTARTASVPGAQAGAASRPDQAARHSTLVQRIPRAAASLALRALPLAAFVGTACLTMSLLTTDGTPQARALESLINIYLISRIVTIVGALFFQPEAPQLRLLHLSDRRAAFAQRWVKRIASVLGGGAAAVETAANIGLSDVGHSALLKAVALVGHVMVSILILQCARPVAARIRGYCADKPSLDVFGRALADAWAPAAASIVMALWCVWALDVQHGYHVLIALGGRSAAVLIAMRIVSIIVFGALARVFEPHDTAGSTVVHRHAYRYYPLLTQTVTAVLGAVTLALLLQVWGVPVMRAFGSGTVGHRLVSAGVTIGVAAVVALLIWEAANIAIERRLENWTRHGNVMRAARLRTLLPMLRTLLFVLIALIVAMTGLNQLGVNVAPLLAGASIFGVALGFGSQKLVQDFITGIFLLLENAMQVGDGVTLAGVSGTVEYLSIRTVRLRAGDGSLYTIPFSSVSTVNNANRGLGNAAVKVSIAYGEDIDRAVATLKEIGAALRDDPQYRDGILSDFSYWGVDEVSGAALVLAGQMQCSDTVRWSVQREFNRRIAELFHARGIRIANPQRTVVVRENDGDPGPSPVTPAARQSR